MKPYRRIIHPTDLSDHCQAAFVHALKIALSSIQLPCQAGQADSRRSLEILHCSPDPEEADFSRFPRVRQKMIGWGVLAEGASQQDVVDFGLDVRKQVTWGEPSEEIAREAEEREIDLLVMASHARGSWSRFLQESISSNAIQRSQLPGLLLPKEEHGFVNASTGEIQLQRVLIPVAAEPDPWAALNQAVRLLTTLGPALSQGGQLLQAFVGKTEDFPAGKCPQAPPQWEWGKRVLQGEPVEALADFAAEWKPQLTVMASQGRNDWKDRWLGSTMEQLLSQLHCPILVAPAWPN